MKILAKFFYYQKLLIELANRVCVRKDDISVASFLKRQNGNVENAFQSSNPSRIVKKTVLSIIAENVGIKICNSRKYLVGEPLTLYGPLAQLVEQLTLKQRFEI